MDRWLGALASSPGSATPLSVVLCGFFYYSKRNHACPRYLPWLPWVRGGSVCLSSKLFNALQIKGVI